MKTYNIIKGREKVLQYDSKLTKKVVNIILKNKDSIKQFKEVFRSEGGSYWRTSRFVVVSDKLKITVKYSVYEPFGGEHFLNCILVKENKWFGNEIILTKKNMLSCHFNELQSFFSNIQCDWEKKELLANKQNNNNDLEKFVGN